MNANAECVSVCVCVCVCVHRYIVTTWGFHRSPGCFLWLKKTEAEEEEDEEEEECYKTCRSSDFCSPDWPNPTQEV